MFDKLLPRNAHRYERALRITIGAILLSLVFFGPQTLWGLIGLVPLATGIVGSCPLYRVLGINTCRTKGKSIDGRAQHDLT